MTGTRVLLVEDDPHVLAASRTVLAQHGFGVLQARTAAEGLRALAGDPDVVLLHLGLPDQDGLVLCGRIRQRSSPPYGGNWATPGWCRPCTGSVTSWA